jgi:hypothetical protein
MNSTAEISVFFDEPFWVTLIEKYDVGLYSVSHNIIGTSEPQGVQLVDFFNQLNYAHLKFTDPEAVDKIQKKKNSFKKQLHKNCKAQDSRIKYVYSKAYAMLKEQQEYTKIERKRVSKIEKDDKLQLKFELRQLKQKVAKNSRKSDASSHRLSHPRQILPSVRKFRPKH